MSFNQETMHEIEKDSIWEDETKLRSDSMIDFLRSYDYKNSFNTVELHYSSDNTNILEKVKLGEADISEIQCYYKHDKIERIKVVFNSEEDGSLDLYLSGESLEQYLSK